MIKRDELHYRSIVSYKGKLAELIEFKTTYCNPNEYFVLLENIPDEVPFEEIEGALLESEHILALGFKKDKKRYFWKSFNPIPLKSKPIKFTIGKLNDEWFWAIVNDEKPVPIEGIIAPRKFKFIHELQFVFLEATHEKLKMPKEIFIPKAPQGSL
jgi:hypothetical protein